MPEIKYSPGVLSLNWIYWQYVTKLQSKHYLSLGKKKKSHLFCLHTSKDPMLRFIFKVTDIASSAFAIWNAINYLIKTFFHFQPLHLFYVVSIWYFWKMCLACCVLHKNCLTVEADRFRISKTCTKMLAVSLGMQVLCGVCSCSPKGYGFQ